VRGARADARAVASVVASLAVALALAPGLTGCGPATTPDTTPATTPDTTPAATPAGPASPATGVLLGVTAEGLARVKGFRLRTAEGQEIEFEIGALENGVEFPPGHLAEHLASSSPVRVFFRPEGDRLVVYRLEDASP
jgi:hypothetical protein